MKNRDEYVIEGVRALDKKYLKQILEFSDIEYQFPCKITLISSTGCKQYYVEQSNIRGCGFVIIDWGPRLG
ncbi:hypothetical protein BK138_15980 [Paenibacillus rhizosphaerae]|uniref:Uncharacterized protein n=1 Tax=Paenibacillus rhizosphaerae TaxID=297318 RepID=A0A1R1ES81_9BACL|nr:hypothetical protein BK138_15980 [Paenibacillus rhizosphaerae]